MEKRLARAAVVTLEGTLWVKALSPGTSTQSAELIALTMTLELDRGKRANINTDSHYVFPASMYTGRFTRKRGSLPQREKLSKQTGSPQPIKAVWHPKQVSMIHCPRHQKGDSTEATGNQRLDQTAKEAAQKSSLTPQWFCCRLPPCQGSHPLT
jgi:ribonuclease HI